MLQYPINVYPEETAIDTDSGVKITFTFNGDFLTTATYHIYDYTTGEIEGYSYAASSDRKPLRYNGEELTVTGSSLINGHDYLLQLMLTQSNADGTDNVYDMPVLHGVIQETQSSVSTILVIEDKITGIYEWGAVGDLREPTSYNGYIAAGMIIKINNESHFIDSYNYSTGELTLDSAFSFAVEQGTRNQIYSNYLISPQYFFKCRSTPELTQSVDVISFNDYRSSGNFVYKADYSQDENSLIKYYNIKLYYGHAPSDSSYSLFAESGKIYSQKIEYNFFLLRDVWYHTEYLKFVCEIVTQDDMTVEYEKEITIEPSETEMTTENMNHVFYKNKHLVRINADWLGYRSGVPGIVIRTDVNSSETTIIPQYSYGSFSQCVYLDFLASSHGTYKYTLIRYDNTTGGIYQGTLSETVETDFDGYTITAITKIDNPYSLNNPKMYGKELYLVGDTWQFVGEIDNTTVTQNTDKYLHTGYGKYPSVSSTDVNYMSGTLSAMIGYVNCTDREYVDNIELVKAWRKFIMQKTPFILKSQKGDVWIVNVTDNPVTEYQEDYYKVPTRFSFSWVECMKTSDIIVTAPDLYFV